MKTIATLRGIASVVFYSCNTVFWAVPILFLTVCKLIIPLKGFRRFCSAILNRLASNWVAVNRMIQWLVCNVRWELEGLEELDRRAWYLLIANHQSWVDILVLQHVFYGRIPFLKFFLKKELFWVPILGLCWWALDFPFMKRYSRSYIKKHPHLKNKDYESALEACEKFKILPVTVMNFVEGTRYTPGKHNRQRSPFKHLLKPKSAGIAFVVASMAEKLHRIIDVTIVYPEGVKTFWQFACGEVTHIKVAVKAYDITPDLVGDYIGDRVFRKHFHHWLSDIWQEKDVRYGEMLDCSQRTYNNVPTAACHPQPINVGGETADGAKAGSL
jgi:1-acyl-sn-glycerol-3-phosphate acyltransferase